MTGPYRTPSPPTMPKRASWWRRLFHVHEWDWARRFDDEATGLIWVPCRTPWCTVQYVISADALNLDLEAEREMARQIQRANEALRAGVERFLP